MAQGNLYDSLRKQAASRRDDRIRAARAAFNESVKLISQLEREIEGTVSRPYRVHRILDMVRELVPTDRPFTVAEMVTMLSRESPDRVAYVPTIRSIFTRLEREGIIKRVGRDGVHVHWASVKYNGRLSPHGAATITTVAKQVLGEKGPLRLSELIVAMRESGYRSEANPRKMLASVAATLCRNADTFRVIKGASGGWLKLLRRLPGNLDHRQFALNLRE